MTDEKHSSTGGFFSGLMFGAMAGALGYYLLKTEDGKKAREKLNEEWEKAKSQMQESGVIEDATKSLPETIQHTIQHITGPKKPIRRARKKTTKKSSDSSTPKTFKGAKKAE